MYSIRDAFLSKKCSFFEHCSKGLWPPPPFIWTFVLFCGGYFLNAFLSIKNGSNNEKTKKRLKRNIFLGLNCRGRAPLNQRSFERCSKKFGQCSKICAMLKNSMFELQWRPLKSFKLSHGQHHWRQYCPISSHLVSSLIGSQLVSSLKKLFVIRKWLDICTGIYFQSWDPMLTIYSPQ